MKSLAERDGSTCQRVEFKSGFGAEREDLVEKSAWSNKRRLNRLKVVPRARLITR